MLLPKFRLISHKLCPYVQRARIVLYEKSIPHEIEFIDLKNKPSWFLEISPLGKVPVLLVNDEALFESSVIAEYLDEITPRSLHPGDPFRKAVHRSWIEFASNTLAAIAEFYNAKDAASFSTSVDLLRARFARLENELDQGAYFAGEKFSLVDAAFGPVFRYFDVIELYADLGIFDSTPKIQAWRGQLSRRKSIRCSVVSDYAQRLHKFFCEKTPTCPRWSPHRALRRCALASSNS